MDSLTVGQAAARTGWSPRMLRYLERVGLVVPARSGSGYRQYGLLELNQLRSLSELRRRFGVGIDELAFTVRLQHEPALQAAVETWLADASGLVTALGWEQRKHERLLAA
ncbi:MAG: MerR family transcriptional regulator [Actinobacteria bacterium]|nr:MAG: MerR family transcriptional regulator [Actinomycetota bacterium]